MIWIEYRKQEGDMSKGKKHGESIWIQFNFLQETMCVCVGGGRVSHGTLPPNSQSRQETRLYTYTIFPLPGKFWPKRINSAQIWVLSWLGGAWKGNNNLVEGLAFLSRLVSENIFPLNPVLPPHRKKKNPQSLWLIKWSLKKTRNRQPTRKGQSAHWNFLATSTGKAYVIIFFCLLTFLHWT